MPQVCVAKKQQTRDIVTKKEGKANKPNFSKLILWSKCHKLHEHYNKLFWWYYSAY
jgi:hypothetical protein